MHPFHIINTSAEINDRIVSRLYLQGALKEEENLIRKIQKNRLKKSQKQSNNAQLAA